MVALRVTQLIETGNVIAVEVEATLPDWEVYTSAGTAVCDPKDKFNPEVGLKLALGRAIRQIGRDILHEGQASVHAADKARKSQEEASAKGLALKAARAKKAKKEVAAKNK
jgi:hypothetical protein